MMVCLGKEKEGLGIKELSTFNKDLLCKWSRGVLQVKEKPFGIK